MMLQVTDRQYHKKMDNTQVQSQRTRYCVWTGVHVKHLIDTTNTHVFAHLPSIEFPNHKKSKKW